MNVDPHGEPTRSEIRQSRIIFCVFALSFLSNFASSCADIPILQLYEDAICRTFYANKSERAPNVEDRQPCKIPVIQDRLAYYIGYKSTFDAIAPALTSIWYGSLANRYGRRLIITLACTGEVLHYGWIVFICTTSFAGHMELVWVGSAFFLIGGGRSLLLAMCTIIIVDVIDQNRRYDTLDCGRLEADKKSASLISILHAILVINGLVGLPFGAALMSYGLSAPLAAVFVAFISRYAVILLLPETCIPIAVPSAILQPEAIVENNHISQTESTQTHRSPLLLYNVLPEIYWWTLPPRKLQSSLLLLAYFFWKRLAFASEGLMYQYMAEKLQQPFAVTVWIRLPLSLSAVFTTAIILPYAHRQRQQLKQTADTIAQDLRVARISLFVLAIGFVLFMLSPNLTFTCFALLLCGAGETLEPALQALASCIIDQSRQASFFSTIAAVDTLANLISGPLMAYLFAFRDQEGYTYGFCFLGSSCCFGIMWLWTWIGFFSALPRFHGSALRDTSFY